MPGRWIAAAAIAAAALAVWVTLHADFLAYPGWLAAQKADIILGPVLVGLYWIRRRPGSRFGPLLIATGLVGGVPYILQSSSEPVLFAIGILWEGVIYALTFALILSFPSGRLEGRLERVILAVGTTASLGAYLTLVLFSPQIASQSSISACEAACPENGLLVAAEPSLVVDVMRVGRTGVILVALAAVGFIVWRVVAGTPPRRRALVVGAPVAVAFLLSQAAYQTTRLLEIEGDAFSTVAQWMLVATRASIWYGFLVALIAAELFAARVLRRVVIESLRRPALGELEAMLREPLGDPGLRLGFRRPDRDGWVGADGEPLADPASGCVLTEVERDGQAAAAIIHDAELAEEPELLQAAGAVALLAQENTATRDCVERLAARPAALAAADRRRQRGRAAQARARPPRRRPTAPDLTPHRARDRQRAGRRRPSHQRPPRRTRARRRRRDRGTARARPRHLPQRARRPRARARPARHGTQRPAARRGHGPAHRPLSARDRIGGLLLLPGGAAERDQARRPGRAHRRPPHRRRTASCASRSATTAPASTSPRPTAATACATWPTASARCTASSRSSPHPAMAR